MAALDQRVGPPTVGEEPQAQPALPDPLPKHRYPWPIVAAGAVTLLLAAYSFIAAPGVMNADRDLVAGRAAMAAHDYATAEARLKLAYEAQPQSHKVQIAYAEAAFANAHATTAMDVLQDVDLTEGEWTEMTKVMPDDLESFFEKVK